MNLINFIFKARNKKLLFTNFFYPSFLVFFLLSSSLAYATVKITIINADSANEGFNDTTTFTAVAGNSASTLGQARLNALQHAANLLGNIITSNFEIKVNAQMNSQGGDASSAKLASAGAPYNVIVSGTVYPISLGEKIANQEISIPVSYEIGMVINSDIDGNVALGTNHWYYGLNSSPPVGDYDFVTVAMHELIHGLGFASSVALDTGVKVTDINNITYDGSYMQLLEHHGAVPADYPTMTNTQRVTASISDTTLHWLGTAVSANSGPITAGKTGTHIHMYAPNPRQTGSSVSHFNSSLLPNQMMEPFYTSASHDIGLAAYLLNDIGWGTTKVNTTPVDISVTQSDSNANINIGSNETYNLIVSNNTGSTATEVVVTGMMPSGATFISAMPDNATTCFQSNKVITCHLGDITMGAPIGVAIVLKLNTVGTNTNTVFVEGVNPDGTIANNFNSESSPVIAPNVDLSVTQTNTATPINYASNETYAITVTNNSGTTNASALVLTSTLPTNATYVSFTGTNWSCTALSNVVTCNLQDLALATASNISIVATLNTEGSNTNTITIAAANSDPSTGNNTSAVITTVKAVPPPPPSTGGGSCFIATAAYGNNMESDVRSLRAFRDEYLLTNAPGRWFVKTYYRYSPAIANVIRDNKTLKKSVRVLLSPFVAMSRQTVSQDYLDLQQ